MSVFQKVTSEISEHLTIDYTDEELSEIDTLGYRLAYFFSLFPDTIFAANEVNRLHMKGLAARKFLKSTVPARKRYGKWPSIPKDQKDRIRAVSRYLNVSPHRAKDIMASMSSDMIDQIVSVTIEVK